MRWGAVKWRAWDLRGEQGVEDVGGAVGCGGIGEEAGDLGEVVASGDEGWLYVSAAAHLLMADVGHERVAEAFAAGCVFRLAAFGEEERERLGGTAMDEGAVFCADDLR